jgi:hypothetical protein
VNLPLIAEKNTEKFDNLLDIFSQLYKMLLAQWKREKLHEGFICLRQARIYGKGEGYSCLLKIM